jgi:hypothetical protein
MENTLVALYDTLPDAEAAVRDLVESGIDRSQISLVANDTLEEYTPLLQGGSNEDGAKIGSGIGAVVGGLGGVLLGLGALTIPGIGPILAAGPMAAVLGGLVGAGTGFVAGGALGALTDVMANSGVSEEEARFYIESLRRGGTLVLVQAHASENQAVRSILSRHRLVNIHERSESWQQRGWSGFDSAANPYTKSQIEQERALYHRDTPDTSPVFGNFDDMQLDFERHFDETYGDTEVDFDYYRPAYFYGYQLAHYDRFVDWEWDRLEPEARKNWELRKDIAGTWEDFKEAVYFGWAHTREALRDLFNA